MMYQRYYQNWHDDSEEHFQKMVCAYKLFLKPFVCNLPKNSKIIEIGCGVGYCLAALKDLGFFNSVGVELDKSMADQAQQRGLSVINTSIQKYVADNNGLGHTNLVLMFDVLEHIPKDDVLSTLEVVYGALSCPGTLICQVPNCYSVTGAAYRYVDWTHQTSFSIYSLDHVLFLSGFRDIKIKDSAPVVWPSCKYLLCKPWSLVAPIKKSLARKLFLFMLQQEVRYDGPVSANLLAIAKK